VCGLAAATRSHQPPSHLHVNVQASRRRGLASPRRGGLLPIYLAHMHARPATGTLLPVHAVVAGDRDAASEAKLEAAGSAAVERARSFLGATSERSHRRPA